MQVIGYTRLSTSEQAADGVTLDVQAQKIHTYALVKDWTVAEVIRDEGVSAKHLKRPGLERLVALVKAGEVGAVIVHKLDRLTRSVKDLNSLVELFEKKRVALVSLQESLDATTATGRLMMNLLASVSQWEREVIGERTKDAMQHLKAQGERYCHAVFDDVAVLAVMQQHRAAGLSYAAIAHELNSAGIPSTLGGQWLANAVRRILLRQEPKKARRIA
jgi:DNA invertase Pin-like site-specific DNA recombinase